MDVNHDRGSTFKSLDSQIYILFQCLFAIILFASLSGYGITKKISCSTVLTIMIMLTKEYQSSPLWTSLMTACCLLLHVNFSTAVWSASWYLRNFLILIESNLCFTRDAGDGNVRLWKDYVLKDKQKLVTAFSAIQGHRPGVRSVNAVVDWQQQSGYLVHGYS